MSIISHNSHPNYLKVASGSLLVALGTSACGISGQNVDNVRFSPTEFAYTSTYNLSSGSIDAGTNIRFDPYIISATQTDSKTNSCDTLGTTLHFQEAAVVEAEKYSNDLNGDPNGPYIGFKLRDLPASLWQKESCKTDSDGIVWAIKYAVRATKLLPTSIPVSKQ